MTQDGDTPPRRTQLYGAIDVPEYYPPTLADSLESAPTSEPPEVLLRYRVDDVLGRGGMGEVLSARDEQIGRSVAIKRLRIQSPSDQVVARFLREARIQGRLEHPAVVPVHELVDAQGGPPFFVMKQLTGTTLADVLPLLAISDPQTAEKFTLQQLLRAFIDVCLAIEFAHTRGIVHRDLKPANIMLGDFGEVYVLDWGIARVADDDGRSSFSDVIESFGTETVAGTILGTPGYISPEQIRGDHDLDGRADVYSLGCILFEILTLTPLHPRGQAGVATAIAGVDARASVRAADRDIAPELDRICVRATAVERGDRFATARDLARAVQSYLDGNRDTSLRQELARNELQSAHFALSLGGTAQARRDAIRAAARALALDPKDRDAADLVAHLMLEPPADVPAEVERELARDDYNALAKSGRFGALAALSFLGFFPLIYYVGFRDVWYMVLGPAICLFIIGVDLILPRRNAVAASYLANAGHLLLFVLFSWLLSPMVLGVGPAIIMVTMMATHRQMLRPWLWAILAWIATLLPWLLELAGVGPSRTSVEGSDIVLTTVAPGLNPTWTIVGFGLYVVAVVHLAALLSRLQDDDRRALHRTTTLQAWQLRQLVPRAISTPVSSAARREAQRRT
jgi:eukaryotic-like serine/threonine-protein kinase